MDNLKWFKNVLNHKRLVCMAGVMKDVPLFQLLFHDLSKFSVKEFTEYRDKFVAKKYDEEKWEKAAEHHLSRNRHHWQYWIDKKTGQPKQMPKKYVREMVADWMATSREKTGSWCVRSWFLLNHKEMVLHPMTKQLVIQLIRIG